MRSLVNRPVEKNCQPLDQFASISQKCLQKTTEQFDDNKLRLKKFDFCVMTGQLITTDRVCNAINFKILFLSIFYDTIYFLSFINP